MLSPMFVLLAVSLGTVVLASSNGMDMNMDGPMDLMMGTTKMYLHFTPGDMLWFMGWTPMSSGAMVGTCIGLFLLAVIDRWIAATRSLIEAHWRRSAEMQLAKKDGSRLPTDCCADDSKDSSFGVSTEVLKINDNATIKSGFFGPSNINAVAVWKRSNGLAVVPFIASHDIPRGIIHFVQAILRYAFMLAVMTFQLGFIFSICVGFGVGEILFGRFGGAHNMH